MAIFRKKLIRTSEVTVAIEAENWLMANKIFDDWLDDEKANNWENINELLTERNKDEMLWTTDYFKNVDEYNRSDVVDDFFVEEPKSKEPLYDLYIRFKDSFMTKAHFGCQMTRVFAVLSELNDDYILTTGTPVAEWLLNARKHGTTVIYMDAERRS